MSASVTAPAAIGCCPPAVPTPYKRDAEKIAEELNALGDRIDTRIRELLRGQIYAVLDDSVSLTPEIMD